LQLLLQKPRQDHQVKVQVLGLHPTFVANHFHNPHLILPKGLLGAAPDTTVHR
jgi:hypothetical protein